MTPAPDALEALRALLLADSDVTALVVDRVRCLALHADDAPSMPRAAVVLKPAGGPKNAGYMQHGKKRVDVTCYGTTLDESWDLYLAVEPVLASVERVVSQGVLLHSATETSKGASGIDPLKQWPTTYSTWLVLHAETAAA